MTSTTLAEVASETITIEEAPKPERRPTCPFAHLMSEPERNPFPDWTPAPLSIKHYRIPNAILEGQFRGLFVGTDFVNDTRYLTPEEVVQRLRVQPKDDISAPSLPGPAIIGSNGPSYNYFHWMTQGLPALDIALRREGQHRNACLVLPKLTQWQEDALRLLGHGDVPRVTVELTGQQYSFAEVEYSDILAGSTAFSRSATVTDVFRRLRDAVETPVKRDRLLYVARTDTAHRKMRNEPALIQGLRTRGFEIIEAGRMTLEEQITTFKGASVIVGPHGAGLTNVVFCLPGTILYEIVPAAYHNGCFCNLALAADMQYWADAFESDGPQNVITFLRDWESDTAKVLARVDEIMGHHRRQQEQARTTPISAMDFLRGTDGALAHGQQPTKTPDEPSNLFGRLVRAIFRRG